MSQCLKGNEKRFLGTRLHVDKGESKYEFFRFFFDNVYAFYRLVSHSFYVRCDETTTNLVILVSVLLVRRNVSMVKGVTNYTDVRRPHLLTQFSFNVTPQSSVESPTDNNFFYSVHNHSYTSLTLGACNNCPYFLICRRHFFIYIQ